MKLLIEEIGLDEVQNITEEVNGKKYHYITGIYMQAECVNGNGRRYPLDTMSKEVERYNKVYIKENRAFGELNHPECFGEGVEVLTTNGWKFLKDVVVGEEIYTLNPETELVEIQAVTNTVNEKYTGQMISIKNRTFDVLVTPNHRFPKIDRYGNFGVTTSQEIHDSLIDTNSLSHTMIPRIHRKNIDRDSIKEIQIGDLSYDFFNFVGFLGLYLAEGHTKKRKDRKNGYVVTIFQNEGPKADKIRELLSKSPLNWLEYKRKNKKSITWSTHNKDLGEYLYQFGLHYEKYVDPDVIAKMTCGEANEFLDWFVLGDGRKNRHIKYQTSNVFSTSEKLIDDISHISFLAGCGTKKRTHICTENYTFAGRIIKKENKRPLHFNDFITSKGVYIDNRHMKSENVDYDGNIYCLTVPNGFFYARSNGYTFWSGNSPKINLDKVSHLIVELKQDKNDFFGKARLLDTPNGIIAQKIIEGGGKLGVSSRGMGTIREERGVKVVQNDFRLATAADIVADPSAPNAFVQGIMENKEWIWEAGLWKEVDLVEAQKKIHEARKADLELVLINQFQKLMNKL